MSSIPQKRQVIAGYDPPFDFTLFSLVASETFLLIGDPQITDAFSYKRTGILQTLTEYYSDRYMRRNYKLLTNILQPQTVFFMGDLMDGGREWDDEGWYKQTERFMRLFKTSAKMQFMAGNHDIGFGNGVTTFLQERFESVFGPPSYGLTTNTPYSIVVLDTVSLSSSDPAVRQKALDVLYGPLPPSPRILMSHVPLYRPDTEWCGPYRGRQNPGTIRQGRGYQYQNLLTEELSRQILERVQPIAVFSGDDHDYCEVTHTYKYGAGYGYNADNVNDNYNENTSNNGGDGEGDGEKNNGINSGASRNSGTRAAASNYDILEVVEMSVPTFNMAQGVISPGVMLLDLSSGIGVKLCWLPDQISLFIGYGCLAGLSIGVLAIVHGWRWIRHRQKTSSGFKTLEMADERLMMYSRNSSIKNALGYFARDSSNARACMRVCGYAVLVMSKDDIE
ncbi:hypothetical protein PHYBLDRAFT_180113 [Phycomyces blakesleeanus NRRL 1555(-)]|uniref:Calcineurin-like phosphoesterase domain-containing protein n=1 Tax=Phycomyces blakesleeanus (strain ATCC 8743b / DSM 1359 / FGSC 10004 / NBRC 33097 / NRRL 1555) TaxID=763407 RepID=A0A162Q239_PHYB8|nr:hypothetical protein PHYBLDRAFT_180113 [Phycomyces blakesleeanus NRRL 1555(-)]OAD76516.1 hypothetical protein PHYBLDRAFT_180113 [Phycomyces blakesleeanus NRRL 1555(-)]|eukprot:XP_018294556.1 hypothetical protein PHYBLDRAFT_180113 [Phycomyces blakesleeanus NRRL 1555(-)]